MSSRHNMILRQVAAVWIKQGFEVRFDYCIPKILKKGGFEELNRISADIAVINRYAYPGTRLARGLAIEVKEGKDIHDLAQGIGQTIIYKLAFADAWLALPNAAVENFKTLLKALPVKVLNADTFALSIRGISYDAVKYWRGTRQVVN